MMAKSVVAFELVVNSDEQISALYNLLKERTYSISHRKVPSFEEHEKFVCSNPYRYWYLISFEGSLVGSFYVKFDNSISPNVNYQTYD